MSNQTSRYPVFNLAALDARWPSILSRLRPRSFLVVRPEDLDRAQTAIRTRRLSRSVLLASTCDIPTSAHIRMTGGAYAGLPGRFIGEVTGPGAACCGREPLFWLRLGRTNEAMGPPVSAPGSQFVVVRQETVTVRTRIRDLRPLEGDVAERVGRAISSAEEGDTFVFANSLEAERAASLLHSPHQREDISTVFAGDEFGEDALLTGGPEMGRAATFIGWVDPYRLRALVLADREPRVIRRDHLTVLRGWADYDYTTAELHTLMGRPDFEGVFSILCPACGVSLNWAISPVSIDGVDGWRCPGCGQVSERDDNMIAEPPATHPAFGPSFFSIRTAELAAASAPSEISGTPPAGTKVAVVTEIEDKRGTAALDEAYAVGMYVLVPASFPDECALHITENNHCHATPRFREGFPYPTAAPGYSAEGAIRNARTLGAPYHDELTALVTRCRPNVNASGKEGQPRRICVHQADEGAHEIQLAFALEASRRFDWRVLIAYGYLSGEEISRLHTRAYEIDPTTEVGVATTDAAVTPRWFENRVTLATQPALAGSRHAADAGPDGFDLIIVDGGHTMTKPTLDEFTTYFRGAKSVVAWTSFETPHPWNEGTINAGRLTIFEPSAHHPGRSKHAAGAQVNAGAFQPGPDQPELSPPNQTAGIEIEEDYRLRLFREPELVFKELDLAIREPRQRPEAIRISTISYLVDGDGQRFDRSALIIDKGGTSRLETGMYIVVPSDWPGQCPVRVTADSCHAVAEISGAKQLFRVWPETSARRATEEYERRTEISAPTDTLIITEIGGLRVFDISARDDFHTALREVISEARVADAVVVYNEHDLAQAHAELEHTELRSLTIALGHELPLGTLIKVTGGSHKGQAGLLLGGTGERGAIFAVLDGHGIVRLRGGDYLGDDKSGQQDGRQETEPGSHMIEKEDADHADARRRNSFMSKRDGRLGRRGEDEPLPKYVKELCGLCRRYSIPCRLDTERRRATLTLPEGTQDYTSALTAIIANIRSGTRWSVDF